MVWGVTFLILIIKAMHVLTLAWFNCRQARLLFSKMSALSPSPSASLAEDGDVNVALKALPMTVRESHNTAPEH
jgi:hypothetical protein